MPSSLMFLGLKHIFTDREWIIL